MNIDSNIIATAVGAITAAIAGFLVQRFGKRGDARAQAEAALIGIGPQIITQQNIRIDQLSAEIDKIWRREHECREELAEANRRIDVLEGKISNV